MDYSKFWWTSPDGDGPLPPTDSIPNSLRFRNISSWLQKTDFGTTPSSTFTMSMWVKLTDPTKLRYLYGFGNQSLLYQSGGFFAYQEVNSSVQPSGRMYRDPSAWYHVMVSNSPGSYTLWINGELEGIIDRTVTPTNDIRIGDWSGQTNSGSCSMYVADVYWMDGRTDLTPEAFGRYNEAGVWVPREVDFTAPPTMLRYSDFLTADNAFDTGTNRGREYAFNGLLSADSSEEQFYTASTTSGNMTFAPPGGITFTDTVQVWGWSNAGNNVSFNGGATQAADPYQWVTIASGGGTLNTIELSPRSGNSSSHLCGIRVDGEVLLDPFSWSADLFTQPGNLNTPDWNTTERKFADPGGAATGAFDGSNSTEAGTLYNTQEGGNNQSWIIWRPSTPIVAQNSVVVWTRFNGRIWVNQNDTGIEDTGGAIGLPGTGVDVSSALTFPVTINNLAVRGGTSEGRITKIVIDGQTYVDGANPSYGANGFHLTFQDPDNLGLDTSGNQNNFTATGFVTERPANYTHSSTGSSNLNSYPNEANGVNAPFMEPSSYVYYSPAGAQSFIYDFHSPIVVTGSLEVIAQGSMDQSAGYGSNTVTIEYSDGSTTVSNFSDLTSPPVNSSTPGYITVSSPGDAITKIIVDNPAPAPAINGGFAGLKINGNKLLLSTTASAADYDLMQDSPTQNYATLNPLELDTSTTLISDSNLNYIESTGNAFAGAVFGTQELTGKKYWEVNVITLGNTYPNIGISNIDSTPEFSAGNNWLYANSVYSEANAYISGALLLNGGVTWVSYTAGDIIGLAYDATTRQLTYTKNGGDAKTVTLTNIPSILVPMVMGARDNQVSINYGQQPFLYTPPAGFEALQTQNLPAAPIADGRDHFQAIVGAGSGVSGGVGAGQTGGNFSQYLTNENGSWNDGDGPANAFDGLTSTHAVIGGFNSSGQAWYQQFAPEPTINYTSTVEIWTGNSNNTAELNGVTTSLTLNGWTTIATGSGEISVTNPLILRGNTTHSVWFNALKVDGNYLVDEGILATAQRTFPNGLWWIKTRPSAMQHQLVDSVRGGNLALLTPAASAEDAYSVPSDECVAWCWKAGDTVVENTDGNRTSQVCVNKEAGFSIFTFTGVADNNNTSVGHGLGVRPEFYIIKDRDNSSDWWCYHRGIDPNISEAANKPLILNRDNSATTNIGIWNGTPPSPDILTIGPSLNDNVAFIGYAWHSVPGYSAFGSYQGNGSTTDGPFIYTGHAPSMILIKGTTSTTDWYIFDSTRETSNPRENRLMPNLTSGELGGRPIDFLSNGFKIRGGSAGFNTSGETYVYCAFAENPFGGRNVSPVNAR